MDGQGFDNLARQLGRGQSRRSLLRGFLGGGVALAAAGAGATLAAGPNSVQICHRTGNGQFNLISVSTNAVNAHLAHGDDVLGSDAHCRACGDACGADAYCSDNACVPNIPESCLAGYAPDQDGGCVACNPGSASADGLACIACDTDTYAANSAQIECSSCSSGYTTTGATGATACTPVSTSTPLICTANDQCDTLCPGVVDGQYCYCGTTVDTLTPVCYDGLQGCVGPRFCDSASDCYSGEVCVNMNGGCGGCDAYTGGRGTCQPICMSRT